MKYICRGKLSHRFWDIEDRYDYFVMRCIRCEYIKIRKKNSFVLWWEEDKLFVEKNGESKQMIITNEGLKINNKL